MDVKQVLSELGLSEGEIKVYMALLKLGSSPVSALKEETKLHRTTIYDFIEKLLNKGLVNHVIKNNVTYYNATHPNRLADFLKEKVEKLNNVLPELIKLSEFHKEEIKVEVYKGKEGYKTALGLVIEEGKDLIGMGFDDEYIDKVMGTTMDWYFRQLKEKKIHERVFTREGATFFYPQETTTYKFLPKEFFSPNMSMTFGKYVVLVLWEPFTSIVIENKPLADGYKKWFEMLWEQKFKVSKGLLPVKGIFESHFRDLKKREELVVFGSSSHIPDYFKKYFDSYIPKLTKKGVRSKIIFDEDAHDLIKVCVDAGWQVKTLPRKYISPIEVNIWGNNAAIILWKKEPVSFVIEDKEVADGFRAFFEIQWDIAKKVRHV
ncbi:helix-turn-helix domain-containing protein [Candidatus Woesearchaeota archaeon]|nr:helix-turn-helix domain-containing protein [Candidatus Woesearchaeota archaeon]